MWNIRSGKWKTGLYCFSSHRALPNEWLSIAWIAPYAICYGWFANIIFNAIQNDTFWNCYSFEITSVSCFRYQNKRRQHTYSWYHRHKKHTHRNTDINEILLLCCKLDSLRSQKLKLHWSTVKLELYWYYSFSDCMSKCIKANDKSAFIIAALEQDRFIYSAALLFCKCVLENHTSDNFSI